MAMKQECDKAVTAAIDRDTIHSQIYKKRPNKSEFGFFSLEEDQMKTEN